jgi:Cu(I)/Ag(I) efflux system protein CusF
MKSWFVALLVFSSLAQSAHAHDGPMEMPGAAAADSGAMLSEGVIRKVDRAQGKLTIRHGPLENLGMPAMTMVFRATDPALLDRVQPGDKVKFRAEQINGVLSVSAIEPLR